MKQRRRYIYINIILMCCGGFWVPPHRVVRTHLKTSVQKYLDLHRREMTRPLNFPSLLPKDWGSPSLGAPWADAQTWHMQEQHTARFGTLIHSYPHLYPGAVKPGHLLGKGKQGFLQTGTTKGHCSSVHPSSPPYRSECTFPVLQTPPKFQVSHEKSGIRRFKSTTAKEHCFPFHHLLDKPKQGIHLSFKKIKLIQQKRY